MPKHVATFTIKIKLKAHNRSSLLEEAPSPKHGLQEQGSFQSAQMSSILASGPSMTS